QVSQVSCAVAVSVFGCPGLFGSTDPTMSHVTDVALHEFSVSPVIVPVAVTGGAPTPRSNMFGFTDTGLPPTGRPGGVTHFPPWATSPRLTAVLLIAALLSVTVQLKSAVPPVFWATYCTVSASAATLVPFTVKAFQPRHDAVPSSLFDSKPTSMNGPAPHLICLSAFTLHVSHVSCAVAVSFFRAEGFAGSTEPTISHVTETVLQEFCVSPAMVPVTD